MSNIPEDVRSKMLETGVWREECPVGMNRLKLLQVEYMGFDGIKGQGKIIVLDVVEENVKRIFLELLKINFPIFSVKTIDEFSGSDDESMAANNSSGFNFRKIANATKMSIHSYGLAIDINPLVNPYITKTDSGVIIAPPKGEEYLDRKAEFKGKITQEVVNIFKENKFSTWGGDWSNPVDYHHFEIPRSHAEKLISLTFAEGKRYLNQL